MRVTPDMKIKEVLKINEYMLDAFVWLAPEFERLRYPALRKAMSGRVSVEQAARVAKLPLTEVLYVLNLTAGEEEKRLTYELQQMRPAAFAYHSDDPPLKPRELAGLADDDPRIRLVDVMPQAARHEDPQPFIMRALSKLRDADEVLLVRHPFDPIPLRDLFARRGFASWAEERRENEWYIYFYRPTALAAAVAHPPLTVTAFVRAVASGA